MKRRKQEPDDDPLEALGMGAGKYFWQVEEPDEETRDKREAEISASLSWSL